MPRGLRVFHCEDWRMVRHLRLRALRADPMAFLADGAAEAARGDDDWQAETGALTWVAATLHGRGVGLARSVPAPDGTHLESVWVDRTHRRAGVGSRLVGELLRIERRHGVTHLLAWVVEGNTAADLLYRRVGFQPTGERQPLGDGRHEVRLAIRL